MHILPVSPRLHSSISWQCTKQLHVVEEPASMLLTGQTLRPSALLSTLAVHSAATAELHTSPAGRECWQRRQAGFSNSSSSSSNAQHGRRRCLISMLCRLASCPKHVWQLHACMPTQRLCRPHAMLLAAAAAHLYPCCSYSCRVLLRGDSRMRLPSLPRVRSVRRNDACCSSCECRPVEQHRQQQPASA
jgi:hypothetical protein